MASFAELWDQTPTDKFGGMKSDFADRLKAANEAWQSQTGKAFTISSGARTKEEQSKLYANRGNNPNLVAKPGSSKHEIGEAADIDPSVPNSFLNQFGLHRPHGAKDPVHVEAFPEKKSNQNFADLWESTQTEPKSTEPKSTEQTKRASMMETLNRATKTNAPIVEGLASLGDTLYGVVPSAVGAVTYAGGRALGQTPEEAAQTSQKVAGSISQPLGKALGVTETAGYKNEATKQIMDKIGQYIGESADVIAQKTGIPKTDVENMLGTLSLVAGKGLEVGGKAVGAELKAREVPPSELLQFRKGVTPEQMGQRNVNAVEMPKKLKGVGAAQSELNPYPALTGQETARGEFPQIKFEKMAGDVEPLEQRVRAQIISEINPMGRPRSGLITGNENIIRNEYTLANSSERTPAGDILKQEIANEQKALPEYAKKIVKETGADELLPDNESRAYRIRNALDDKEGLAKDIETAKKSIYEEAFNKVGNNSVEPTSIENLLNNKQFQAELKLKKLVDFTGGAKELLDLHKTEGFEGTSPGSIAGLEKLRQSLNASWSPENSFAIRRATRAIDEDIARAGGSDTLLKARALHQAEQNLFGSKGIKDLLTEQDANGIQTGIPNEKLIDKLNKMPNDQWKHIYDTLGKTANGEIIGISISPEVQAAAKAAQAEMKGAIARDIYEAGAAKAGEWNPNSVNNKSNFHNTKIKHAFDPEEIRKIHTLNYGGYLMPSKSPYEGGGLQLQRVAKMSEKLPVAGKTLGAMTGIPLAETAGTKLGEKGAKFFKGKSLKKQAQQLEQELEKNKELGTKLSDIANLGKKK
jgi:hypothetical protein